MPPDPTRVQLHIDLTKHASEGLRYFAAYNGVSITALIEVIGNYLHEDSKSEVLVAEAIDEVVLQARQVDAERRSRSKKKR